MRAILEQAKTQMAEIRSSGMHYKHRRFCIAQKGKNIIILPYNRVPGLSEPECVCKKMRQNLE